MTVKHRGAQSALELGRGGDAVRKGDNRSLVANPAVFISEKERRK